MKKIILCFLLFTSFLASADSKRTLLKENDKKAVVEVLKKNDVLFNAFLKKNNALVEKTARDLSLLLSKSPVAVLKKVKAEAPKLNQIKAVNTNEANLRAYESVVNPLIKVIQQNDVGANYNVFSCPMVKKSWIQDITVNKGIKNVYAMEMLECGIQDTKF